MLHHNARLKKGSGGVFLLLGKAPFQGDHEILKERKRKKTFVHRVDTSNDLDYPWVQMKFYAVFEIVKKGHHMFFWWV